jgi:hypothetical protein
MASPSKASIYAALIGNVAVGSVFRHLLLFSFWFGGHRPGDYNARVFTAIISIAQANSCNARRASISEQ